MANRGAETTCGKCGTALPGKAKFCLECGHPVTSAVSSERPALSPSARDALRRPYTPPHLARRVLRTRAALEGERKQVTVLFVDIRGSTGLSADFDPEDWHQLLDRFFEILTRGVHRYEGTVNQYTGDGIMALFGAPIAHEDHAHRACWAALELRDALRDYARELEDAGRGALRIRMGLHSGEVVVGAIGDDLRMDYTAQGYTVGIAARIEQAAEPGQVWVSERTAKLVEGFFEMRSLDRAELPGVPDPPHLFELLGPGALRNRLDAARANGRTAWAGREAELGELESAAHQARDGYGRVVFVSGDPGVGKTRLCLELLSRCEAEGMTVSQAHCPTHGRGVPYLAIAELLRAQLRIGATDPERAVRQRVSDELERRGVEAVPIALELLGVAPGTRSLPPNPATLRRHHAALLGRLVQRPSSDPASVLFLDDAHWIDAESHELLGDLIDAVGYTHTLLLVNHRLDYVPPERKHEYLSHLRLEPLEGAALDQLVLDRVGDDASARALRDRIAERSGGNPFFVETLVEHLVTSGALVGEPGALRAVSEPDSLELPAAARTLLAARLDRLPDAHKHTLELASVIGRSFPEALLLALLEQSDPALQDELPALGASGLLQVEAELPERLLAFQHPLLHEATYAGQVASRRRESHARVAAALEHVYSERLGEKASLIAQHWELADRGYIARRWRQRAALRVSNIQIRGRRPS